MAQNIVKPYEGDKEQKKNQVRRMFDKIAPYYDFLNRLLSLGTDIYWRRKAIKVLKGIHPGIILDVATGTGDLAIEAARQIKPEKIIGIDISDKMLEIGRDKIRKKELSELIELQNADSENIPFQDNTFDGITVAFGVRNFENLERGLNEIYRVLKEDGKLVVLEFSRPTLFPFKQVFNFYFKYILPSIGKFTSKDPKAYQYLYESVQAFPDGTNFVNILTKTGFKNTSCKSLSLGICSIYQGTK